MKKLKFLAFVVFIFASYNYSYGQIADESNGTITEKNGNIEIHGNDQVKTFKMDGQKLLIVGNDHTITVNGYVSGITIQGTGNKVMANSLKSVMITGVENKVSYRISPNKNGKATSATTGVDNSVVKVK